MSFRRKGPSASASRSGTKPFLNSQTLVSTGLSQLDAALGGGFLLNTLNVVETPPSTLNVVETPPSTLNVVETPPSTLNVDAAASSALATDLLSYFLGEGVADGKQHVAVVAPDANEFINERLPLELSLAQKQVKQQLDKQLTIAWQYGKYENKQSQQRFCHSFDLSKKMHKEMLVANMPTLIDPLSWEASNVYERILVELEELVQQNEEEKQVLRVGILGLGSPLFGAADAAHMAALFTFFRRLRPLMSRSKGAVCLAVVGSEALAAFPDAFANELRHMSDTVLTVSSFAGTRDMLPEELQEFQGSLTLTKLPRVHALACHAPSNTRFGMKRERRKLKIDKFHLPPEGSRSGNSSSTGCGSASKGADPLAF